MLYNTPTLGLYFWAYIVPLSFGVLLERSKNRVCGTFEISVGRWFEDKGEIGDPYKVGHVLYSYLIKRL